RHGNRSRILPMAEIDGRPEFIARKRRELERAFAFDLSERLFGLFKSLLFFAGDPADDLFSGSRAPTVGEREWKAYQPIPSDITFERREKLILNVAIRSVDANPASERRLPEEAERRHRPILLHTAIVEQRGLSMNA